MTDGRTRSSFHLPIPPARAHHGRMPRLALPLLTMLLTLCGAASAEAGVFTGVGDSEIGGKGAIEVAVTVDENGAVTAIEVTKNGDTAGISDPAVAQIPGLIVEQQTANVDAVAGATKTSMTQVVKGVAPFLLSHSIVLLLMLFFPAIVLVPAKWLTGY